MVLNLWRAQKDSFDTLCLQGNRNDFGAFHFQNLLVVEPFVASQLCSGSHPAGTIRIKKNTQTGVFQIRGAPRRIRTLNLLIRSQMLYPIEPWAQCLTFYTLLFEMQEKSIFISFSPIKMIQYQL